MSEPLALPYRTPDVPGIGGRIRAELDDFQVTELPAYLPCGHGEHAFLQVEKRGRTTEQVASELARTWRLAPTDVAYAGQKDKYAVTVQTFCLPAARIATDPTGAAGNGWRVLSAARHTNRLRIGHLRGNRFAILVRDPLPAAAERAAALLAMLGTHGVPNYFGPQRFGAPAAAERGPAAILAEARELDGSGRTVRYRRRMLVSRAQSELFNAYLAERLRAGLLDTALLGDVLKRRATGGLFVCTDPLVDSARLAAGELVTTGPLFGPKMFAAAAEAAVFEAAVLTRFGITDSDFAGFGALGPGTRRPNLVFPELATVEAVDAGVVLRFDLPAGAYATVVLREVLKSEGAE